MLNEESQQLNHKHHAAQSSSTRPGHTCLRNQIPEEALHRHRLSTKDECGTKSSKSQSPGHINLTRRRPQKRNRSEQVTEQNIEEATPHERQILVSRMSELNRIAREMKLIRELVVEIIKYIRDVDSRALVIQVHQVNQPDDFLITIIHRCAR